MKLSFTADLATRRYRSGRYRRFQDERDPGRSRHRRPRGGNQGIEGHRFNVAATAYGFTAVVPIVAVVWAILPRDAKTVATAMEAPVLQAAKQPTAPPSGAVGVPPSR